MTRQIDLGDAEKKVSEALGGGRLLLVVGRCKVQYEGRAASKLSEGDRLLVIKHDGTFLVHQSTKMAAINYQGPGAQVSCELGFDANDVKKRKPTWLEVKAMRKLPNGAKESITVRFYEVYIVESIALKDDSHLSLFGTEKDLAKLLMDDLSRVEPGMVPIKQESDIRKGTIDILATDAKGNTVIIEVKRRIAGLDAVTQLERYVSELSQRKGIKLRGILCAPDITASAKNMLERSNGLEYCKVDFEVSNPSAKIRSVERKQKGIAEFI